MCERKQAGARSVKASSDNFFKVVLELTGARGPGKRIIILYVGKGLNTVGCRECIPENGVGLVRVSGKIGRLWPLPASP